MNYEQTCEYMYRMAPAFERVGGSAYKEGLANTLALDDRYGHPHRHFRSVHLAGTNGKGSCSHTIAAILQAEGYRVGLYTSPHLVDFRERIRINGECIDKEYVVDFVARDREYFERLRPSFFELTTAMAFRYFAEQRVDIAVIETGLGGRLDCTNIITPMLSVITNISYDHTQFLGDTLPRIAAEKAGIIKRGIPVTVGEATDETRAVFEERARALSSPIVFAQDVLNCDGDGSEICAAVKRWSDYPFSLTGDYQTRNKQTILTTAAMLDEQIGIKDESVRTALARVCDLTGLAGRWQRIGEQPLTVCDTGHNVAAWQWLAPQIAAQTCRTRRIIFGMVDDKDLDGVLALLPRDAVFYFTQARSRRAVKAATVAERAAAAGLAGHSYDTVSFAYETARAESSDDDFLFIGGSSYLVADLLTHLQNKG